MNADAGRKAKYGDVLPTIEKAYADMSKYSAATVYLQEALAGPEAHTFAYRMGKKLKDLCNKEISAEKKEKIKKSLLESAADFIRILIPSWISVCSLLCLKSIMITSQRSYSLMCRVDQ